MPWLRVDSQSLSLSFASGVVAWPRSTLLVVKITYQRVARLDSKRWLRLHFRCNKLYNWFLRISVFVLRRRELSSRRRKFLTRGVEEANQPDPHTPPAYALWRMQPPPQPVDILFEGDAMEEDELMAISRRLDELLQTSGDPREALVELVRQHGPERSAEVARIVFGSWRTRIDRVEEILKQVLAEHGASD